MTTASNYKLIYYFNIFISQSIFWRCSNRAFNTDDIDYSMEEISIVQANQMNKYETNGEKDYDILIKKKSGESIFVKYRLEDRFKERKFKYTN